MIELLDWTDVKLGRIEAPDSRDGGHLMGAVLQDALPRELPEYRYWLNGPILNQGNENSCVGYTCAQWAQTSPIRTRLPANHGSVIYRRALQIDEFHGEQDTGTSIRAGVKVLEEQGRVERYVWAYSAEEVKQWILAFGPVIIGTEFTTGMRDVVGPGWYMNPTGNPVGGHAYLLNGYSRSRHAFRMINSWRIAWGDRGRAWLKYGDLDMLLRARGDAVGVIEKRAA